MKSKKTKEEHKEFLDAQIKQLERERFESVKTIQGVKDNVVQEIKEQKDIKAELSLDEDYFNSALKTIDADRIQAQKEAEIEYQTENSEINTDESDAPTDRVVYDKPELHMHKQFIAPAPKEDGKKKKISFFDRLLDVL